MRTGMLSGISERDKALRMFPVSDAACMMPCRYERSGERLRTGRALVQRHVALPEDLANKEGKGLLVSTNEPITP